MPGPTAAAVLSFTGLLAAALTAAVPGGGCAGERPEMLAPAERTGGPRVVYDPEARPLPEIPFPNDAATRLDPTSPTGRRVNVSELADTEVERRFREKVARLDGFGVLAPLTVRFDAEIDLEDLRDRQLDGDLANDAVVLVRLGGDGALGEACAADRFVPLDFGEGHYPLVLEKPCQYHYAVWEGDYNCTPQSCEGDDPRWTSSNTVFETVDEDTDGDGVMDPYEDTDFDGRLDRPNTWSGEDSGNAAADDLVTFYERETNTLVAWPVVPLREGTRYAAVLTRHLRDEEGRAIESPFEGVSAASQAAALSGLGEYLGCRGLGIGDVAFAWTFTTGTPTRELPVVREGLYGRGPLAFLGDLAPPSSLVPKPALDPLPDGSLPAHAWVMPQEVLGEFIEPLAGAILQQEGSGEDLTEDTKHVGHWVVGEFRSPSLLADKDGRATERYPDDQDESWDVDVDRGTAHAAPATVTFACAVPRTTAEHRPPFPVVLYAHGYSGATFEIVGFAGRHARAGLALCAIEAPAHGLVIPDAEAYLLDLFLPVLEEAGFSSFIQSYLGGRARDNDGDGKVGERDNGTDFWVADVFHTRDMVRQLVLDQMQFLRILRAVDGVRTMERDTDGDGKPNPLADFDGDGVPDIGGWRDLDGDGKRGASEPENPYYAWGQSLGGISSALLAAVEPAIRAAAPVSGAGGLVHVALRSTNLGVPEAIFLPLMGPFVTFRPHLDGGDPDGRVDVGFLVARVNEPVRPVFHVSSAIAAGDRVIVRNLRTGKEVRAFAPETLRFRVGIESDALRLGERRAALGITEETPLPVEVADATALLLGDPLQVVVLDGWDGPVKEVIDEVTVPFTFGGVRYEPGAPLVAIAEGLGYTRNSPDLRRLLAVAQTALEPGDPAAYARHIFAEPLDWPEETGLVADARAAGRTTRFAYLHTAGDPDVPIATGLTLARAAGLLGRDDMQVLLDHHVPEGVERVGRHPQRKVPESLCPPAPDSQYACPPARLGEEDRYRAFFLAPECASDQGSCPEPCALGEVCHYDGVCVPCDPDCAAMADAPIEHVHFDAMDLDGGRDRLVLPEYDAPAPIRPTFEAAGGDEPGVHVFRIPYLSRYGSHGVPPSVPDRAFNVNSFVTNQLVWFFQTDGAEWSDDPCMEDASCEFLPCEEQP